MYGQAQFLLTFVIVGIGLLISNDNFVKLDIHFFYRLTDYRRFAACPYNFDYTSTLREKCMEYLRYDTVHLVSEPHIKSTGAARAKKRGEIAPVSCI
jgi:hypothetical protein